jgi:hypothetical protein
VFVSWFVVASLTIAIRRHRTIGRRVAELVTVAALTLGAGLGTSSAAVLAWFFAAPDGWRPPPPWLGALTWPLSAWLVAGIGPLVGALDNSSERRVSRSLIVLLVAIATLSLALFLVRSVNQPHGDWDAWAIWNTKARFLFRGGEAWGTLFSPELVHAGYPLLLPGAVTAGWLMLGHETTAVPAAVAFAFTYGIPALILGALACLRDWYTAVWATLVTMVVWPLTYYGSAQTADVPLAFFILLFLVLVALELGAPRARSSLLPVLQGVALGCIALIKQEGLPCALVLVAMWGSYLVRNRGRHGLPRLATMLLASLPFWTLLLAIRQAAPPTGMALALTGASAIDNLVDPARHMQIVSALGHAALSWPGPWPASAGPFLLVILLLSPRTQIRIGPAAALAAFVVIAMLALYYVAYLVTPYDLSWHINTSLHRILTHVWPAAVWAFFLSVSLAPGRDQASAGVAPGRG